LKCRAIAEYLAGRCRVYDDAFAADLRRLRAAHGAATVIDALRLLGKHADQSHEHKQAVRDGVEQTLAIEQKRLIESDLPRPFRSTPTAAVLTRCACVPLSSPKRPAGKRTRAGAAS
jgi:hypothetical protein